MDELIVRLSERELLRLQRILLDEDAEEALLFLKEKCLPLLKEREQHHCVPVFEVNYKPSHQQNR